MRSREAVRLQDMLPAFQTAGHHEEAPEAVRSSLGALHPRKVSQLAAAALRTLEREPMYAGVIDTPSPRISLFLSLSSCTCPHLAPREPFAGKGEKTAPAPRRDAKLSRVTFFQLKSRVSRSISVNYLLLRSASVC